MDLYPHIEIKLFDSSNVKLNTVWNNILIKDFSHLDASSDCHIFAFGGQFSSKIESSVLGANPSASIFSLDKLFQLSMHDDPQP